MSNLIWNPDVFIIGQTQFDASGLKAWMEFNSLEEHMEPEANSPLLCLWTDVDDDFALERVIEFGGRHCYRSWASGRDRSDYVRNIIEMEHGSVLEHSSVNMAMQGVSRSLSLELVRHRVGVAISQESQRYVDAEDIQFVVPPIVSYLAGGAFSNADEIVEFHRDCASALEKYKRLQAAINSELDLRTSRGSIKRDTMAKKRANEAARAHLPNACETRLLWTANMRLLRHFFWLRGGNGADLEIRRLTMEIFQQVRDRAPSVFADMAVSSEDGSYGVPIIVASNA